jgi:hypothetical protein
MPDEDDREAERGEEADLEASPLEGRCQFVSPDGAPCCYARGDHDGPHKVAWIGRP